MSFANKHRVLDVERFTPNLRDLVNGLFPLRTASVPSPDPGTEG